MYMRESSTQHEAMHNSGDRDTRSHVRRLNREPNSTRIRTTYSTVLYIQYDSPNKCCCLGSHVCKVTCWECSTVQCRSIKSRGFDTPTRRSRSPVAGEKRVCLLYTPRKAPTVLYCTYHSVVRTGFRFHVTLDTQHCTVITHSIGRRGRYESKHIFRRRIGRHSDSVVEPTQKRASLRIGRMALSREEHG